MELREAIEHCEEIIKKMDNCECRKDHEELKEFLKELQDYEDTGLTPEQIRELVERDAAKAPLIYKNKFSDTYVCPNCNLVFIHKDETGWFCGKHYKFCPDCGQRIKWEE